MKPSQFEIKLYHLAHHIMSHGIRYTARKTGLSPMRVSRLVKRCRSARTTLTIDARDVQAVCEALDFELIIP